MRRGGKTERNVKKHILFPDDDEEGDEQMLNVPTRTTNMHGDEIIVTTTSPYEQVYFGTSSNNSNNNNSAVGGKGLGKGGARRHRKVLRDSDAESDEEETESMAAPRDSTSDWRIPPAVSNWKNTKGFVVPLEKRLTSTPMSGEGANAPFAKLSQALYVAERSAREEVAKKSRPHVAKLSAIEEARKPSVAPGLIAARRTGNLRQSKKRDDDEQNDKISLENGAVNTGTSFDERYSRSFEGERWELEPLKIVSPPEGSMTRAAHTQTSLKQSRDRDRARSDLPDFLDSTAGFMAPMRQQQQLQGRTFGAQSQGQQQIQQQLLQQLQQNTYEEMPVLDSLAMPSPQSTSASSSKIKISNLMRVCAPDHSSSAVYAFSAPPPLAPMPMTPPTTSVPEKVLSPKEAFRMMSHKFHGKIGGKGKEAKPAAAANQAQPEPEPMITEDEVELLQEARGRLADTKLQKAKRKKRINALEEQDRLVSLAKRREAAPILIEAESLTREAQSRLDGETAHGESKEANKAKKDFKSRIEEDDSRRKRSYPIERGGRRLSMAAMSSETERLDRLRAEKSLLLSKLRAMRQTPTSNVTGDLHQEEQEAENDEDDEEDDMMEMGEEIDEVEENIAEHLLPQVAEIDQQYYSRLLPESSDAPLVSEGQQQHFYLQKFDESNAIFDPRSRPMREPIGYLAGIGRG